MQLGMIGLGRMGGNMAKRIAAAGHEVVGYDRSPESDRTVASLKELVAALKARVWCGSWCRPVKRPTAPSTSLPSFFSRAI